MYLCLIVKVTKLQKGRLSLRAFLPVPDSSADLLAHTLQRGFQTLLVPPLEKKKKSRNSVNESVSVIIILTLTRWL